MNLAIELAERGLIPDFALRAGIKALLRLRLMQERSSSVAEQQERFEAFIKLLLSSPIAIDTDAANEQHYEVPAELFKLMLGPRLKYSSCFWEDSNLDSLAQAEEKALDLTCLHAQLEDGMRLLDLGCGWGSLSIWAAQRYPKCQITAVSNSSSQGDYIRQQCKKLGIANLTVETSNINSFKPTTQFDRVISIEAMEHMRNYEKLLQLIYTNLTPSGKMLVHIFCHREFAYPFETEGPTNWMGKNFFTGGIMPSDSLLLRFQKDLTLTRQWRWNGKHYAKTLRSWLMIFDQNKGQALSVLSNTYGTREAERWFNRWRIFLHACAELFAYSNGNEWWVSHYLFEKLR